MQHRKNPTIIGEPMALLSESQANQKLTSFELLDQFTDLTEEA